MSFECEPEYPDCQTALNARRLATRVAALPDNRGVARPRGAGWRARQGSNLQPSAPGINSRSSASVLLIASRHDHGDRERRQVLLVLEIAIGCDEGLEAARRRSF
jgi:hypothetical protein